jgi:1,2-diacylglycerol 3-beta-glucosyltransferase
MFNGITAAANIVVVLSLIYLASITLTGKRKQVAPTGSTSHLAPVFLVPCLNEERVVSATLDRLLAISGSRIVVVDDGSEDKTASFVRQRVASFPARVMLVSRTAPNARKGKGAALNQGFEELTDWCLGLGLTLDQIVVCVMDADGVIDANAVEQVLPWFLEPRVAGCQILVRIRNRSKLIGRLQDIEFTSFTELVQQGRSRVGSSGLGGNGQFTRLVALRELGDEPWSDCLVEDLDLGLQLLSREWELRVVTTTSVGQQGLESVGRLIRQRTRWVQGLFQAWRRIPSILASRMKLGAALDVLYALLFPAVLCIVWPVVILAAFGYLIYRLVNSPSGDSIGSSRFWASLVISYVFTFGPSLLVLFHYRRRTKEMSIIGAFLTAHVYTLFQLIWYVAGWKALARIVTRRSGWVKTERYAEEGQLAITAGEPSAAIVGGGATVGTTSPPSGSKRTRP